MKYRGQPNWPPVWVRLGRATGGAPKTLSGEIGRLKDVRYYTDRPGKIYITIDHHGIYVGCLLFDNYSFCEKMFEHLRRCYGIAISQVGSSELP